MSAESLLSAPAAKLIALMFMLALACRSHAGDWQAKLRQLPKLPQPDGRDWLIEKPARSAGVFQGASDRDLVLDNGLVRRTFRLSPNAACTQILQLSTGESLLRSVRPECEITLDGKVFPVGGLVGQPVHNYLLPTWVDKMTADPNAFKFVDFRVGPIPEKFPYKPRLEWLSRPIVWPPKGIELTMTYQHPSQPSITVDVIYDLVDGLPLMGKRFKLHNASGSAVKVDTFAGENLALVEASSEVEEPATARLPNLHVETDYTRASMSGEGSQKKTVRWLTDPTYGTQVNYNLQTPCVLQTRPEVGPGRSVQPGESFDSFTTWILAYDSTERTRQALSLARMYRTLAPWSQENPLIFHVRSADPASVKAGVDQAANVGFELMIMTFGSGFDIENDTDAYRAGIKQLVDYAHSKRIAIGGYSLLASRSVSPTDDVINPATGKPGGFATFGNSPCLGSPWGIDYFRKLRTFFPATGADVLEHDGSYPGDPCASTSHPGHVGYEDSQWSQWETITHFYQWCRGQGIYLNVPDWYFLNGSNKTGMGYRETNWSLPREHQEIVERQNIMDGTRFKSPTMGWMFVPLTEYQGGGAAATIEPLKDHLDHYERRLVNLFGAGVQACFRGPRLYDSPETEAMVKKWVSFFKANRAILESDLVPLRRADGNDWDGWLHVYPGAPICGMAFFYNPTETDMVRRIVVPLYYTGLKGSAEMQVAEGRWERKQLAEGQKLLIEVKIPARKWQYIRFRKS